MDLRLHASAARGGASIMRRESGGDLPKGLPEEIARSVAGDGHARDQVVAEDDADNEGVEM